MDWTIAGLILGGLLIILLMAGVWIAIALGIVGTVGVLMSEPEALGGLEYVCWNNLNSFVLTAVPLFLLMGSVILEAGVSTRFYKALSTWLDYLPGSLIHTNIVACAMFAALCGSSVATAAAIGTVAIPEMEKRGYDRPLTYGSLAAGGTLGILIPPSISLLIYGAMVEQSIGRLFMGGFVPGLILASIFSVYLLVRTVIQPELVPRKEKGSSWKVRLYALRDIMPIIALILLVLGGIYAGVTTPTEAAAAGSAGALVIALAYGGLSFEALKRSFFSTIKITSMVLFILIGAQIMSFGLVETNVPRGVVATVAGLNVSRWVIFTFIVLIYLVLGMFVDAMANMLITLPVIYPLVLAYGFDPIWFGIVMVVLLEVGLITPPVGMNIFVIHGVARGRPLTEVIRGAAPYVLLMLLMVGMLAAFPNLVLWLPSRMTY